MSEKNKASRDAEWAEAKRLCRLNAETVRMAKQLGLNPRSLIKNRPNQAQPWKAPVHVWIREMYAKRMAKAAQTSPAQSLTQTRNTDAIAPDAARTIELRLPPNFDTPDDDPWDVSGCGAAPFLRQHHDFTFQADALAPERTEVLYDRDHQLGGETDENEIPF